MKLIRELNLDLDFARMVWPEDQYLASPCVKYPRQYYGQKTVLRAVAEVVLEHPLDPPLAAEKMLRDETLSQHSPLRAHQALGPQGPARPRKAASRM